MQNLEDFYILGEPIETRIGDCHFITVKDYPKYMFHLESLSLNKEKIVYLRHNMGEKREVIEELQKLDLVSLILLHVDLKRHYEELFAKVFNDEDAFYRIESQEEFFELRDLIMRMNCVKEEKINPNPEIQAWIEKSKKFKQQNGTKITFNDIISSIAMFSGIDYEIIFKWSIFKMHMSYHRIGTFKGYDTSTLFATVSSDKIDIKDWSEHIDLFKEDKHGMSRSEFDEKASGLFGSR